MRYLSPLFVLFAACGADPVTSAPDGASGDTQQLAIEGGPALYEAYCASCHGTNGDGNGLVQLDRPARSFKDGGFSFGNTVEALKRTISAGIAGSPMPGFAAVLNDDQLTEVAEHVRSLGPEVVPDAGAAAILVVEDRPKIVRGSLPPLREGGDPVPRGLTIGGTDGLSWEYQIDNVRLLGIRQGQFVDRTDWVGRGGTPLKPLGRVIEILDLSDPVFRLQATGDALHATLVSTRVEDGAAIVTYELRSAGGDIATEVLAVVDETGSATLDDGPLRYTRTWTVSPGPSSKRPAITIDPGVRPPQPALEVAEGTNAETLSFSAAPSAGSAADGTPAAGTPEAKTPTAGENR